MAISFYKHQPDLPTFCRGMLKAATFGQIRQNHVSVTYWYSGVTWGTPVHILDIVSSTNLSDYFSFIMMKNKSDYASSNILSHLAAEAEHE